MSISDGFELFYFAPDLRPIREDICSFLILDLLKPKDDKAEPQHLIDRKDVEILKDIIHKHYNIEISTKLIESTISNLYSSNLVTLNQNKYLELTGDGVNFLSKTKSNVKQIKSLALDEIFSLIKNKQLDKNDEFIQIFDDVVSFISKESAEYTYDICLLDYYYKDDNNILRFDKERIKTELQEKFININQEFINAFTDLLNNENASLRKYLYITSYSLLTKFVLDRKLYEKISQEYYNKYIILDTNIVVAALFHFDRYHEAVLQLLKKLNEKKVNLVISKETDIELNKLIDRCKHICNVINFSNYYKSFDRIKKDVGLSPVLSFFYERWGDWNVYQKAFEKRYKKFKIELNIINEAALTSRANFDNNGFKDKISSFRRHIGKTGDKGENTLLIDLHNLLIVSELRRLQKDKPLTPNFWIWTWDNDFDYYQNVAMNWGILQDRCAIIGKSMSLFIDPLDIHNTISDTNVYLTRGEIISRRSYEEIISRLYDEYEKYKQVKPSAYFEEKVTEIKEALCHE